MAGTTRWFASIGMRPAWVHAYVATLTEIGAGVLLLLGLLTPLAAAGVLGTMLVALVTAHLKNGFFIFRPGQGYEYVLMICVVAVALSGTGAGWPSLDHVIGYPISGWVAYAVCVGAGPSCHETRPLDQAQIRYRSGDHPPPRRSPSCWFAPLGKSEVPPPAPTRCRP